MHSEEPILEVQDLTVRYGDKVALSGIDFSLPTGSITGIIGPNGSGKSTLMKAIMGLIPVATGSATLFGQPLEQVRRRVSYVPQRESVDWDFPVSALDVVLMGRYAQVGLWKRVSRADRTIAQECLEKVGMTAFADRQIAQLSGGQQQRVFIARALAQQADIYLMDEPFAGVDAATEATIIQLLREMAAAQKTVVVVHHDLETIKTYFDWIVMLHTKLVASGPVSQVYTPALIKQTYGSGLSLFAEDTQQHAADISKI